jgi:ribosomal protein S18 acetylase RimI-like enzyme
VIVERVGEATPELVAALRALVPQLSATAPVPSEEDVAAVLDDPRVVQLAAREDDAVVGVLTLLLIRLPTGLKARIEDVVVDDGARGRGAGESLVAEAQRVAAQAGVRHVELSSAPSREAANRLYRRLGFTQRETNVYVWRPS